MYIRLPAQTPDIERVYRAFTSRTETVDSFIQKSTTLLQNTEEAIQIAQSMTSIACTAVSKQDRRIGEMLNDLDPPEDLRLEILHTAQNLKEPPETHEAAAAQLVQTGDYFLKPLAGPGNPMIPGRPVCRMIRNDITTMHKAYIRSIAASMVNYAIMEQDERPQFICDIAVHMERRSEALINVSGLCRAVMHMHYSPIDDQKIIAASRHADRILNPTFRSESEYETRPARGTDILQQMSLITASSFNNHYEKATKSSGTDQQLQVDAAIFWHQVSLNLPAKLFPAQ